MAVEKDIASLRPQLRKLLRRRQQLLAAQRMRQRYLECHDFRQKEKGCAKAYDRDEVKPPPDFNAGPLRRDLNDSSPLPPGIR